MTQRLRWVVVVLLVAATPAAARAQAPVAYRLSFPQPEQHWMQVDVAFDDVAPGPLELHISRASPGRYALHEFARNISHVRITGASGSALNVSHTDVNHWTVTGHEGAVRVTYRVSGERVDGTYLGIDSTHAHINMPSALVWARGLEERPVTVRFEPPAGSQWRVGTQLMPGADAFTYTAPNLQYLMDSPTEFSAFSLRTFTVDKTPGAPIFRMAVHHTGTDRELDGFAADVARIVREERNVWGEYPPFDGNTYTFIADYLPGARGDGMEHRNSAIVTSAESIRSNRLDLLDTTSHEFFHAWNVERIRPRSLEPFNFDDANVSGELWLAEGFTSYYGPLILLRAGITKIDAFLSEMAGVINTVRTSPGRQVHSAEEMSRMAPLVDGAANVDRARLQDTYISYYTWGAAIGLGLDLTLRERSHGSITLDHYMRALWAAYGKPGGKAPGYVGRPYTMADLKATLASVSGDEAFAEDFFAHFIQGRDVVEYERLLARFGITARSIRPQVIEIVPVQETDRQLTADQRHLRQTWLSSAAGNTF